MRILITGITGAIGGALAPVLLAQRHELTGLSRSPQTAAARRAIPTAVRMLGGDAVTGRGLERALAGIEVAYYLIHSMEPQSGPRFEEWELQAAHNFATAAARAGVRRVIYLGGLIPARGARGGSRSAHLHSRLSVEETLLDALPDAVALRASIVIGAHSRSFRLLVRLLERMPLVPLPAWRIHRSAPVDVRDVVSCLARAADARSLGGRSLDIAGPELLSYGALIARIRDAMLIARPLVRLPGITLTPLVSHLAALIAGEQDALVEPLMGGLGVDLIPRTPSASEVLHLRRHSLDAAIEHALRQWEREQPLRAR